MEEGEETITKWVEGGEEVRLWSLQSVGVSRLLQIPTSKETIRTSLKGTPLFSAFCSTPRVDIGRRHTHDSELRDPSSKLRVLSCERGNEDVEVGRSGEGEEAEEGMRIHYYHSDTLEGSENVWLT